MVFKGLNIGNLFSAVTQTSHRQKAAGRLAVSKGTRVHVHVHVHAANLLLSAR